jgi:hypothetical protein
VEEGEDYMLTEEKSELKVSETVELQENKPEIPETISQDVGVKNGEAIFYDRLK